MVDKLIVGLILAAIWVVICWLFFRRSGKSKGVRE